ncbi:Holliday junction endonuclease RuvC [Desulfuromusa kysingii]|uniref:Crossover junction endodeoxyribonuclease RuvC n=1 Tax=Desulfuromusa kysingii TaxID=37625 RepID=A0A1H3WU30_9BACT|nr:crossover junction endodeoxyribonuclease RuvC [Desulfuromusa kysingii]SDZ90677.1 Holliday junction endonuclease RuvC [Desulfuromusa kysingii]
MRILGIDPGSKATGYGFIEQQGNRLIHLDNGAIFTQSQDPLAVRLQRIYKELCILIGKYQPEAVAVEQVFMARNPASALKLGHARGIALLAGINADLPVAEYSALQVKSAVVGYGRAGKNQVQQMTKMLLNLPEIAQEDAADALAVAICHAHSHHLSQQVTQTMKKNRKLST